MHKKLFPITRAQLSQVSVAWQGVERSFGNRFECARLTRSGRNLFPSGHPWSYFDEVQQGILTGMMRTTSLLDRTERCVVSALEQQIVVRQTASDQPTIFVNAPSAGAVQNPLHSSLRQPLRWHLNGLGDLSSTANCSSPVVQSANQIFCFVELSGSGALDLGADRFLSLTSDDDDVHLTIDRGALVAVNIGQKRPKMVPGVPAEIFSADEVTIDIHSLTECGRELRLAAINDLTQKYVRLLGQEVNRIDAYLADNKNFRNTEGQKFLSMINFLESRRNICASQAKEFSAASVFDPVSLFDGGAFLGSEDAFIDCPHASLVVSRQIFDRSKLFTILNDVTRYNEFNPTLMYRAQQRSNHDIRVPEGMDEALLSENISFRQLFSVSGWHDLEKIFADSQPEKNVASLQAPRGIYDRELPPLLDAQVRVLGFSEADQTGAVRVFFLKDTVQCELDYGGGGRDLEMKGYVASLLIRPDHVSGIFEYFKARSESFLRDKRLETAYTAALLDSDLSDEAVARARSQLLPAGVVLDNVFRGCLLHRSQDYLKNTYIVSGLSPEAADVQIRLLNERLQALKTVLKQRQLLPDQVEQRRAALRALIEKNIS